MAETFGHGRRLKGITQMDIHTLARQVIVTPTAIHRNMVVRNIERVSGKAYQFTGEQGKTKITRLKGYSDTGKMGHIVWYPA